MDVHVQRVINDLQDLAKFALKLSRNPPIAYNLSDDKEFFLALYLDTMHKLGQVEGREAKRNEQRS